MRYALHPESEQDLREAAEYYKERAGPALSQALFTEFEHSMQAVEASAARRTVAPRQAPAGDETLPLLDYLFGRR